MDQNEICNFLESLGFRQHSSGKWWQLAFKRDGTLRITISESDGLSIFKLSSTRAVTYSLTNFPLNAVPLNLIRWLAKPSSHRPTKARVLKVEA
jgi:hypothetical protein